MNNKLKQKLKRINTIIIVFGIDLKHIINSFRGLHRFLKDYVKIRKLRGDNSLFPFGELYPILGERNVNAGIMSGHYFHQDLFVATKIYENNPKRHLDIGSRTDGFVAHVAVFRKIEIVDIRVQTSNVKNIIFNQADLMQLPADYINAFDSISSLHAIEHFGLGRYGDSIDYFGYLKAIDNIARMLQPNGKLYFSVPIGRQRIEFNAHRVFSVSYLLDIFNNNFTLESFSFVDDNGDFFENVVLTEIDINRNFGCHFGCGIFVLSKI
jgi:SAM-dependent methyltransferase